MDNCTELWYTQTIDHFSWAAPPMGSYTYQQRYFICSNSTWKQNGGAIFFYNGNEGPVDLYVNNTGLMWENAAEFGALLIFAEHRYYGESLPFGGASQQYLQYLTHEQALADYAELISTLLPELGVSQPVIAFGGSYGGMLSAFFRMKYPTVVAGAISASAPLVGWPRMGYDSQTYWAKVTYDATATGGSAPACVANVKAAWAAMAVAAETPAGLANLSSAFNMCEPLNGPSDVFALGIFLLNAWDTMAMGSYPYPSSYLTGGSALLPAYPLRQACSVLADPTLSQDPWRLLPAFSAAAAVFNNVTQNIACYPLPTDLWQDGVLWDYQYCTELFPEETYFTRDGVTDMFPPFSINESATTAHCLATYGVSPRFSWIKDSYGGQNFTGTNIVFSYGELDPWTTGGAVATTDPSQTIVTIASCGHHMDLFFSNAADPASVVQARATEVAAFHRWVDEWYAAHN